MNRLLLLTLATSAFTATSLVKGVIPFPLETNTGGELLGGVTWDGDGVINPSINPGEIPSNQNTWSNPQILISDFNFGALHLPSIGIEPGNPTTTFPNVFDAGRFLINPTGVTHSVSLNSGGTASMRLDNSARWDGGERLFNSIGLTNLSGVNEITWTITYTVPIATRNDDVRNSSDAGPLGAGLALIDAGGSALDNFRVTMQYGGVFSSAPINGINGPYEPGVQANFEAITENGLEVDSNDPTLFTAEEFEAIDLFLIMKGWSTNGTVDDFAPAGANEAPLHYVTSQTWTITLADGGDFGEDTIFVFSMDGAQYHLNAVPEPATAAFLAALAVAGFVVYRRRRRC